MIIQFPFLSFQKSYNFIFGFSKAGFHASDFYVQVVSSQAQSDSNAELKMKYEEVERQASQSQAVVNQLKAQLLAKKDVELELRDQLQVLQYLLLKCMTLLLPRLSAIFS
jgi:hypothetical protein